MANKRRKGRVATGRWIILTAIVVVMIVVLVILIWSPPRALVRFARGGKPYAFHFSVMPSRDQMNILLPLPSVPIPPTATDIYYIDNSFRDSHYFLSFTAPPNMASDYFDKGMSSGPRIRNSAAIHDTQLLKESNGKWYDPGRYGDDLSSEYWTPWDIKKGRYFLDDFFFIALDEDKNRVYVSQRSM